MALVDFPSPVGMIQLMAKIKKAGHPTIKTPQELVHIRHKITLRQYKYWILMLRAYREVIEGGIKPDESGLTRLPIHELTKFLGYEPVKAELRADLEAIRQEPIIYNVLGKDGNTIMRGAGFISEWELSAKSIGFNLPGFLRECVERLDLKSTMFQALNWAVFNSFTGKYEAVLYKLCKDYLGVQRTPYMTLQEFRDYMGVESDEYTEFKRLSQWVITGPIKVINASELSDITIAANLKRENRRVIGLYFTVTPKFQSVLDFGDDPAFRFARVAISLPQQRKYLEIRSPETIELSIRRANQYAEEKEKKGETVDMGAIYHTAITQDWGQEYESKLKREQEQEQAKKQTQDRAADEALAKKKTKSQAAAETEVRRKAAAEWHDDLPEQARAAIWGEFMANVGATINAAKTRGLESPMVKKVFDNWLIQRHQAEVMAG